MLGYKLYKDLIEFEKETNSPGVMNIDDLFLRWDTIEEVANELNWFWKIMYFTPKKIKGFFNFIERSYDDILFSIKNLRHKLKTGYNYVDEWDYYNQTIKRNIWLLKRLKFTQHGHPADLTEEKWYVILDKIILTWRIAEKISEDDWFYQESKGYNVKLANKMKKINKNIHNRDKSYRGYVMSKSECKVYEEGWKLYQKYFFNLWD